MKDLAINHRYETTSSIFITDTEAVTLHHHTLRKVLRKISQIYAYKEQPYYNALLQRYYFAKSSD